jgi:hypothetical protein
MNDFLDFFFNALMKICPWGSFSMKIFFIVRIFGDSHCEVFLILGDFFVDFFFFFFF